MKLRLLSLYIKQCCKSMSKRNHWLEMLKVKELKSAIFPKYLGNFDF